ncbi:FAD/NAD(P)-binding domain-containing protein [Wallemia mellicola]|nr:FAD/NAD(P)-binding domain-containing protein [Wallemia mellicola]
MTAAVTRNVLVLGGSYAGGRAARLLSQQLPPTHRVILIDRNSHHNHLYVFPRYAVVKGHEHKAFIPYAKFENKKTDSASAESKSLKPAQKVLSRPHLSKEMHRVDSTSNILLDSGPQNPTDGKDHIILHAAVESIGPNSVTLNKEFPEHELTNVVEFDYMVYALGSIMPVSLQMDQKTLKDGTKASGIEWLQHRQRVIEQNDRVVVAGGGALGIQLATDIKNTYPNKTVTLIHSRDRLLPRFDAQMHDIIFESLTKLGVETILQDRIELGSNTTLDFDGHVEEKRVFTRAGKRIECDLVLMCTGQKPNTELIRQLSPSSIDPQTNLVKVTRSMQLAALEKTEDIPESNAKRDILTSLKDSYEGLQASKYPHIYVVGDAADAYGALHAGHTGWNQSEFAVGNIIRQINDEKDDPKLYYAGKPAIKLTTGLNSAVIQLGDDITVNDNCPIDLDAASAWRFSGADTTDMRI